MLGCVLVPRFALACELAERPELGGKAVAIIDHRGAVMALSRVAEEAGVATGQLQPEALARCPELAMLEARTASYQARFRAMVSALEQVAYTLQQESQGVVFFDFDELAPLYSPPQDLLARVISCVDTNLEPRIGVGPSRFSALAAAGQAAPRGWRTVDEAQLIAFLAFQPVTSLPLSPAAQNRLLRLGMRTLGQLGQLSKAALRAQLGEEGEQAWELAHGHDRELQAHCPRFEPVRQQINLEVPITTLEALLAVGEQALNRALRQPEMRGRAARQAVLQMMTERGRSAERVITFKTPLSERAEIWARLREVISRLGTPGPVTGLELALTQLTLAQGQQLMWRHVRGGGEDRLIEALRQLKARYGACPVSRVVEIEPWNRIPERRLALIDFDP
jgi:nucleotidyltransferase/DNA polymerase involved in DNA repair